MALFPPVSALSRLGRRWAILSRQQVNAAFTFACFSAAPVLGSTLSFLVNGAGIESFVQLCRGAVPLSRDRAMIRITIALYAYAAAYLLSIVMNPMIGGWSGKAWPILTLLLFPVLYSGWSNASKQAIARAAVFGSMVACYGAFILAVAQYPFFEGRVEGGAGNAIIFATVTCLAAPVALAGMFIVEKRYAWALGGAVGAAAVAILLSGTRMTWVALFVALAAVLFVNRHEVRARLSRRMLLAAIPALALVAAVASQTVPSRVEALANDWRLLTEEGDYDTSLGQRLLLWRLGLDLALQNRVLGQGPQFTKLHISDEYPVKSALPLRFSHFHNAFLGAWVEAGPVGLVSLIAVFVLAGFTALRTLSASRDPVERFGSAVLLSLVATFGIGGMTGIVVGHDLLDAAFMTFLVVGTYLSAGTVTPWRQGAKS